MLAWDKIYVYIKDLLEHKKSSAQTLWSIAQTMTLPSEKIAFLNLWRKEIHHALNLNKLLQSLGYNQVKIVEKTVINSPNIQQAIEENISNREKWLPILKKITKEIFGNDIYYTFMDILIDDLINLEVLKELRNKTELNN